MASVDSSVPPPELEAVSATDAKNNFGAVLDKALTQGRIAIKKYDEVRAVLLSIREYEALVANQADPLATLRGEFDELVERMQTQKAKAAGRALFAASPRALGEAALKSARRRGR